jgi:hypothetical protein
MNLHALVRGVIPLVNPDQEAVILRSAGYTVDDTGRQEPQYAAPVTARAQVQPVPETVLQHVEGYNQGSIYRHMYLAGDWSGLDRATGQGGDLVYWDGFEWLVDQVVEGWNPTAGWTLIRVVQQRAAEPPEVEVSDA